MSTVSGLEAVPIRLREPMTGLAGKDRDVMLGVDVYDPRVIPMPRTQILNFSAEDGTAMTVTVSGPDRGRAHLDEIRSALADAGGVRFRETRPAGERGGTPYWFCIITGLVLPVVLARLYFAVTGAGLLGESPEDQFEEALLLACFLPTLSVACAATLTIIERRIRAYRRTSPITAPGLPLSAAR